MTMAAMKTLIPVFRRLGPGLITASVVLGPGSVVASSRAGAEGGYRLIWLLVLAAVLMAVYTSMGARLGCALEMSPLTHVSRRVGRWLAVLTGVSACLVTAGFQFGNNLGVAFAMSGLVRSPVWIWPVVFTTLSLLFLFRAKRVYLVLERVMMALVAVMIASFFANLFWTGLDASALARGLLPRTAEGDGAKVRALMATTFSSVAAFYQAYLVRAKGWQREDLTDAIRDAWAGIAILTLISGAILVGAAETLHGTSPTFVNVGQLAGILRDLLGPAANVVFCAGLAAASFSSFIVNAVIGGGMLADGLGMDARIESRSTKLFASGIMIVGSAIALLILRTGRGTTQALLVAQASTLIAAPVCAVLLFALTVHRGTMGDLRNRTISTVLGACGFLVIVWLNAAWLLGAMRTK